jgi:hypothetical protein
MPAPPGHAETILFEVPDFALCLQLQRRLQQHWTARLVGRSESRFVAVPLDGDVARGMLLRAVAEWAGEVGLPFVHFHLGEQMSMVVALHADGDSPEV